MHMMKQASQANFEKGIWTSFPSLSSSYDPQSLIRETKSLIQSLEEALQINKKFLLLEMVNKIKEDQRSESFQLNTSNNKAEPTQSLEQKNEQKKCSEWENQRIEREKTKLAKNDTKNIPKNFGTAICIYIKNNPNMIKKLLQSENISYASFLNFSRSIKYKLNSLIDLRKVWTSSPGDLDQETKRCFRIISFQFMRKHCLHYVFDSRIKNLGSHIRYRKKVLDGMKNPAQLTNLKDY